MGKMLHKILIYMIGILIFLMIVIHVIRNVKKMRNTEQKLLEAENEYKELIETLPEAILIIEPPSGFLFMIRLIFCNIWMVPQTLT